MHCTALAAEHGVTIAAAWLATVRLELGQCPSQSLCTTGTTSRTFPPSQPCHVTSMHCQGWPPGLLGLLLACVTCKVPCRVSAALLRVSEALVKAYQSPADQSAHA